ncbi:hypothetical protein ACFE04_024487 [Oxalis oulophora]
MFTHRLCLCLSLLLLLLLLLYTTFATSSSSLLPFTNNHRPSLSCDSFARKSSRSLCIDLQRVHRYRPLVIVTPPSTLPLPLPLPPTTTTFDDERRFGVEKRLIPSGPNPLHN